MMTPQQEPARRDRSALETAFTWNVDDLFPSLEAWRLAGEETRARVSGLEPFRGRLLSSPAVLADALTLRFDLDRAVTRLYVYASCLADQDTRVAANQGMQQQMMQLYTAIAAAAAFIEPELLAAEPAALDSALAVELRLAPFRVYVADIQRRRAHTLGDGEERLLADASLMAAAPGDIYGILTNADFPYPTMTTADGRTVRVDQSGYSELRASPVRADRQLAMETFFTSLSRFSGTFGMSMNGSIQRARFFARARKYPSTIEAALDGPNIPIPVYDRLVEGVNRHLGAFHRYLDLRRRLLGVETLQYHDLYAPLIPAVDLSYSPGEAVEHLVASLAPLGQEYADVVARGCRERWIDWYPNDGKRSGAYSEGAAYDVHPFILLNYLGKFHDVSTLSHEVGHAMHSYYSNRAQPYPTATYQTFVAEVASTFNEELLVDYMLARLTDPAARLSVLGNYLEGIKGTVFRQTQFAEFERALHAMGERGEALTGESISRLYLGITRRYYGHAEGICEVGDVIAHEWSFIPHFYRDFYVFQYATSFTASTALAARVQAGEPGARERYLRFISSGGAQYPIELLRDAGVDMTTDEPLDLTIRKMERVMDDVEQLVADGALAR
ncbi:MAG: oligoendopeptidase F [Vicinamibacterales bacterium]